MAKETAAQKETVREALHKYYKGHDLHSGSAKGPVVRSNAQAVAIALSEAGLSKSKKK